MASGDRSEHRTAPRGGRWRTAALLAGSLAMLGASGWLLWDTLRVRYARDVARFVYNDNLEALEQVALEAGADADRLRAVLGATAPLLAPSAPYLVVSITDRRLWYKQGDRILFTAPVATGSGAHLVMRGNDRVLHFETPRGRLFVQRRDSAPVWVPPDWHYQEQATKRGLGLVRLFRGHPLPLRDGSQLLVEGSEVVRRHPDGSTHPVAVADGREIVADGRIVIPPFGTRQRRYAGVLGTRRLYLGDGYGVHGTNNPASVGQPVTHGCIRLRNSDIERLYDMVAVGTPVYIY